MLPAVKDMCDFLFDGQGEFAGHEGLVLVLAVDPHVAEGAPVVRFDLGEKELDLPDVVGGGVGFHCFYYLQECGPYGQCAEYVFHNTLVRHHAKTLDVFALLAAVSPTDALLRQKVFVLQSFSFLLYEQTVCADRRRTVFGQVVLYEVTDLIIIGEEFNILRRDGPDVGVVQGQGLRQDGEEPVGVVQVGETTSSLFYVDAPGVF